MEGHAPVRIDYEQLSRELVRALRGERSQVALQRRLRYASNVVYLWESGRRWPSPASFFWLAHRTGVDVEGALDRFLPNRDRSMDPWTVEGAAAILRTLQGSRSAAELGRGLGASRYAVARWLRGDSETRLPDLLALVDLATAGTLDFVACFVDPERLPTVAELWRRTVAARTLVRDQPWAPAVELSLELDDYRALPEHRPGWIAERIGLPLEVETACLDLLAAAGMIRRRNGLWEPVEVARVDARTPSRTPDLKRWWASVGLERIGEDTDGIVSWNLFTVSQEDFQRIEQLQRQHYRAIRSIVSQSSAGDRLVLTNLQLLALDKPSRRSD